MCCFSRPVKNVSSTRIFARAGEGNSQFIVYQMNLEAKEDLAMVLPLPVDQSKGENGVQFINLEEYPSFFRDLEKGFRLDPANELIPNSLSRAQPKLQVYDVGDFQASFVPNVKDFSRLDERFRLPTRTWDQLPEFKRFGFAVFKLKSGARKYHPMAFSFDRAEATKLFFPTLHIHDGKFHMTAIFDHDLYCQRSDTALDVLNWIESRGHVGQFANVAKARGILDPDEHCHKKELKGRLANRDIYLSRV